MIRDFGRAALAASVFLFASCDRDDGKPSETKAPAKGAKFSGDLSWVREMAPGGALAYSADKSVYVVELDGAAPKKVGDGLFPEFSPDGSKLAWVDNSGLTVCKRDGSDSRKLHDRMFKHGGAHWLDNDSLAAILQGAGGMKWYRFWLDGRRQPMPELDAFGINKEKARETDVRKGSDGIWTHVAYRSWKTSDGKGGPIDGGCACSISPDGKSITALQGSHTELTIRPVREGGLSHDLKWLYPGRFDNHRWSSNDERIIVGVEEKTKRMVVIDWRSGRASAFGKKGHKDKTRMYGDFTKADGRGGKAMPALLAADEREVAVAEAITDRGDPVVLDAWPLRTDGMIYLFESRSAPNEFREFSKDPPRSSSGQLRKYATYDRFGALNLSGGSYEVSGESANEWLERVKASGEFAVEATLHPSSSPAATVVNLGPLALGIREGSLRFFNPRVSLKLPSPHSDRPTHIVVSFANGKLFAALDGQPVFDGPAPIDISKWPSASFVFGGGWNGRLEGIAIFARAISTAEAKRRAELFLPRFAERVPATQTLVDAKLVTYTPPLPLAAMDTYRRCVSEHVYEVVKVLDGKLEAEKIRVREWSTLDMEILPESLKKRVGETIRLTLEPEEAHPYLEKLERLNPYEGDDALDMPGFFVIERG